MVTNPRARERVRPHDHPRHPGGPLGCPRAAHRSSDLSDLSGYLNDLGGYPDDLGDAFASRSAISI
jgi:hypothetical protein